MKRILSLVLALVLVLGMVPGIALADEITAGKDLKALGLLKGDSKGDLNEDKELTRAEMMVILSRLNGVEEEAKSYASPSKFVDSQNKWYSNYIAYAESQGWTFGTSDTTFEPNKGLTVQEATTYLLRVLNYDDKNGDFTFEGSVEKGMKIGFLNQFVEGKANILRKDLFFSIKEILGIAPKGKSQKFGSILGITGTMNSEVDMKDVDVLSNIIVEVNLNTAVDSVSTDDFSIEDRGGNLLEILSANLIDETTVYLVTSSQTAGKLYIIASGEKELTFTGVAEDNLLPEVKSDSTVNDNITVTVKFSKEMDKINALDPSNYLVDNDLEILKAVFAKNSDDDDIYTEVILTTSSQNTGTIYEVTVAEGVTDLSGNSVNTEDDNNIFRFGGLAADVDAPEINNIEVVNAEKISIYFDEESDLTKVTAEDISNYNIVNTTNATEIVEIISAELVKDKDDYTKVNLRTSTQTFGNTYEVQISNIADKFGNIISSNSTKSFVGQPADKTGPEVTAASGTSNETVEVLFNEELDEATAEDVANYSVDNDLVVINAELKDDSNDEKKLVELTTSAQTQSVVYKVTVSKVMDEFGNEMGSDNSAFFSGVELQDGNPELVEAYAEVDSDNKTYVNVIFNRDMDLDTAEVASNYYFGTGIGYGIAADQVGTSKTNFKVRVNELEDEKRYTLTVSNVTDVSGNLIDPDEDTTTFAGISASDTDQPELVAGVTLDNKTVKVMFSRKMEGVSEQVTKIVTIEDTAIEPLMKIREDEHYANKPENYILIDKDTSLSDSERKITVASALMEDGAEVVILNLATELSAGHTYDLYANASKVTSSTDNTLVDDPHSDLSEEDMFGYVGLRSENGLPLNADDATAIVGGSSSVADELEIVSINATSNETVSVKFNKEILINGTVEGLFSNQELGSNLEIGAFAVDSDDESILLVRTTNIEGSTTTEFENGDSFILEITAGVYNKTTGAILADSDDDYNVSDKFYSSTQTVQKPAVDKIDLVEDGKLQVTFTKNMHDSIIDGVKTGGIEDLGVAPEEDGEIVRTSPVFKIANDSEKESVTSVEFDGDKRNVVNVYFDNTDFTKGSVYKLVVENTKMLDLLGFYPEEDEEVEFSISSETTADAPYVLEVRIMDANITPARYKIILSQGVDINAGCPFTFTNSNGMKVDVEYGKFYLDGDVVYDNGGIHGHESVLDPPIYYDALEFTSAELTASDSNVLGVSEEGKLTNRYGVSFDSSSTDVFKLFKGVEEVVGPARFSTDDSIYEGKTVISLGFDEEIAIADETKIALEGLTPETAIKSAKGSLLEFTFDPALTDATGTITIEAGAIEDALGNLNEEMTIAVDFDSPTVTELITGPEISLATPQTITFSETLSETAITNVENALTADGVIVIGGDIGPGGIDIEDVLENAVVGVDYTITWSDDKTAVTLVVVSGKTASIQSDVSAVLIDENGNTSDSTLIVDFDTPK